LTTWFKSVCAVGMFKISASLHASTARLTSHLYRRASVSREKAQVSTLLRSLKNSSSRVIR
ncbi:MAG: hypothetical protein Q8P93_02160, partial [bacterium]|nr:hypothetical protein [bacterium]